MANKNQKGNKEVFEKESKRGQHRNQGSRRRTGSGMRSDSKPTAVCADAMPKFNDFSWYDRNPKLTEAVARVAFPYKPGMSVPIESDTSVAPYSLPGVMQLTWSPFVGGSRRGDTAVPPIKQAAEDIFNKVRSVYSGSLEADSPDFIMYMMSLDSIFSYISYLKRLYRTAVSYTPDNLCTPNTLLGAMGLMYKTQRDQIRRDHDKLWKGINILIGAASRFKCPALFPVFNRHYWLNDNVYLDANTPSGQMYVFYQRDYLKFALHTKDTVTVGGMDYVKLEVPQDNVVDYLLDFGNNLITALSSDDAFTISGYLTRAYPEVPNFSVDELELNEKLTAVYEPTVLMQIENAYTPFNDGSCSLELKRVFQDPKDNSIRTDFTMTVPETHQNNLIRPYLNVRADLPSVIDVVEASRLQTTIQFDAVSNYGISSGTEVLMDIRILYGNTDSVYYDGLVQHLVMDSTTTVANLRAKLRILGRLAAFDWHPAVFAIDTNTDSRYCVPFIDITNFTTHNWDLAREISRVCMLSEFNAYNL